MSELESLNNSSRGLRSDDNPDINPQATSSLLYTFYINIATFCVLMCIFEINRHIKSIYFKRSTKRFERTHRVPPYPGWYPFAWISEILKVTEDELLSMIGLDGYMFIRYLNICFRISAFITFWGLVVLVPIYSNATSASESSQWVKYTIDNIPGAPTNSALWAPVIFAYIFSAYFCHLMYVEYKNFIKKRLEYLIQGDRSTPTQTYYTVMLERVPPSLRSLPNLRSFFEKLFPNDVHSVEIALDLRELEALTKHRRDIRNKLEKAVAVWKANGARPVISVPNDFYDDITNAPTPVDYISLGGFKIRSVFDAIEHYTRVLEILNDDVATLQNYYKAQAQQNLQFDGGEGAEVGFLSFPASSAAPVNRRMLLGQMKERLVSSSAHIDSITKPGQSEALENFGGRSLRGDVEDAQHGAISFAQEAANEAKNAATGALRGVIAATRALELLTLGAHYRTSSTAFVTLKSRVAKSSSHQMLLSHEYFAMEVRSSPNPKDIIWDNVSIPQRQIRMRGTIADSIFVVGAVFWSIVVAGIASIADMNRLSLQYSWLAPYQNTWIYKILNDYLAASLLLILLSTLPFIFDLVARAYEGKKLESEIQNSIMTRYFYYQLANVYVAIFGSLVSGIQLILNSPKMILSILGASIPHFSIYFATIVIIKTFTALPFEILRIWPLIQVSSLKLCLDKKKCTKRELRAGAFAFPRLLYGWIYPSLLMVLMILMTYSCIAPLIAPFAMCYFLFAYTMYKYQLLYVYLNEYQSGGYMWYAVFNRSMVALLGGVVVLLCYLLTRRSSVLQMSSQFYSLLPLPMLIVAFWKNCLARFIAPSMALSLENAIDLDMLTAERLNQGKRVPMELFSTKLFMQPSLAEGPLKPEPYRSPQQERDIDELDSIADLKSTPPRRPFVPAELDSGSSFDAGSEPSFSFNPDSIPRSHSRDAGVGLESLDVKILDEIDEEDNEDMLDLLGTGSDSRRNSMFWRPDSGHRRNGGVANIFEPSLPSSQQRPQHVISRPPLGTRSLSEQLHSDERSKKLLVVNTQVKWQQQRSRGEKLSEDSVDELSPIIEVNDNVTEYGGTTPHLEQYAVSPGAQPR